MIQASTHEASEAPALVGALYQEIRHMTHKTTIWQENAHNNALNELRLIREYCDSIEKAMLNRKDWDRGLYNYSMEKAGSMLRAVERIGEAADAHQRATAEAERLGGGDDE